MMNLLIISIAIAGITHLYLITIQFGQLFDFMQTALAYLQSRSVFLFKRLGGCPICTLQLIIDLTFFGYCYLSEEHHPWYIWTLIWMLISGLSHYFFAILNAQLQPKFQPKIEEENIKL